MSKLKKLFLVKFNGLKTNLKLQSLRTGHRQYRRPTITSMKGVNYVFDDAGHTKGRVIYRPSGSKEQVFYFGCGEKFKLYKAEKERDEAHKVWSDEHKVNIKSSKDFFNKEKMNGTGNKAIVNRKNHRVSSRIARRQRFIAKQKEPVLI